MSTYCSECNFYYHPLRYTTPHSVRESFPLVIEQPFISMDMYKSFKKQLNKYEFRPLMNYTYHPINTILYRVAYSKIAMCTQSLTISTLTIMQHNRFVI